MPPPTAADGSAAQMHLGLLKPSSSLVCRREKFWQIFNLSLLTGFGLLFYCPPAEVLATFISTPGGSDLLKARQEEEEGELDDNNSRYLTSSFCVCLDVNRVLEGTKSQITKIPKDNLKSNNMTGGLFGRTCT